MTRRALTRQAAYAIAGVAAGARFSRAAMGARRHYHDAIRFPGHDSAEYREHESFRNQRME